MWPYKNSAEQRVNWSDPGQPICGSDIGTVLDDASQSGSGIRVTEQTAWNLSAVYAAIRLLSETIAQLPLNLYRRTGEQTSMAGQHPLSRMVHRSPNDRQTSFVWRETQMGQALTYGNGYAYIQRDMSGAVVSINVLPSSTVFFQEETDGTYYYRVTVRGESVIVMPEDMLHIPAITTDGLYGVSPIRAHRETLGLSVAATRFGAQFFGNGVTLGGVVKHPGRLSPDAKNVLKNGWDKFRGTGYNGVAILDEGMEYVRIGIPPEDAQFLETRKFQVSEIARIFNIPPHMLRDLEKSSFNNISEQSIEFLRYTMAPWLEKWEQELNRKLLTDAEQEEYYCKFNAGGLLRGTQRDRYEAYGHAINDGWMSRNEVRELEDMNRVDGLDDFLQPLNMGVVGEEVAEAIDAVGAPADEERGNFGPLIDANAAAFARWLSDVSARSKSQTELAERVAKKTMAMSERYIYPVLLAAGVNDRQAWLDWLNAVPIDDLPDEAAIADTINTIIGGGGHGH